MLDSVGVHDMFELIQVLVVFFESLKLSPF